MDISTPEEEDFPGRLLHQAALWDNAELLEDLLRGDQLAHISSQDSWGRTPLHAAATTENSRCLRVLLQAGADPNIPCGPRGDNKTPLHTCSEHGFVGNVMLLLAHNGDLVSRDSNGMTALDIAEKGEHAECMQVLKQAADARELARQSSYLALREAVASGDVATVKSIIADLGSEAELLINMAPSGSNTLLFIACELGRKDIAKLLLDSEADGRIHPITRYSPLYIACFKGRKDVADILLKKFPELVQQPTVECWLPIHAACINGHIHIMEQLLKFPYPQHLLSTYTIDSDWEYQMAFDINMKDVTGQNVLYLACLLGNYKMVDLLLKFKVKATRIKCLQAKEEEVIEEGEEEVVSPTRRRISDGIQSIMTRLNLGSKNSGNNSDSNEKMMIPWELDVYCNNDTETALLAAVRGRHGDIVSALLSAGANPNLHPQRGTSDQEEIYEKGPALVQACRNRDIAIVDLLLKHGARDDDCKALAVVVANSDDILTAKLLSIKAYPDPEHRINKKAMNEKIPASSSQFGALQNLTYSNMFANTPVMINWHCQRCQLSQIRPQWLVDAALHVNPKLRLNPRSQDVVLYAITRLDISNNALAWLPPLLFQLHSLRYLNVAQNKIEKLPTNEDFMDVDTRNKRHSKSLKFVKGYSAPMLEELYLQDNRLEWLPEELFNLPALVTLDVCNNKLPALPFKMWRAPKLKELNVAFNLLKELPAIQLEDSSDTGSVCSVESSRSGDCEMLLNSPMKSSSSCLNSTEILSNNRTVQSLSHHNVWSRSVEVTEQILHPEHDASEDCSQLSSLNLAHNQFTSVPVVLSCLAVNLTRLNLSYNSLRTMSHITSYPSSLKQLDLSHNQVCCWPSLPQIETTDAMEQAAVTCYAPEQNAKPTKPLSASVRRPGRSLRTTILNSLCVHRRHFRLENLRTLVLADNKITRIQLSTDDDGYSSQESEDTDNEWQEVLGSNALNAAKCRLMFPNLSMLDMSNNLLKEIPANINELSNSLSVLNVSGNKEISELPPHMGLLSRLWNLNTRGCNLQEPLKSMIESKKYKTMDIIGYLKSVLEDARPYARIKLMIVGVQGIGKTSLLEQLRQEGSGSYRKKPVEHWAKRMGNKNINVKTSRGTNMSTVGVDIGDWVYEKKIRGQSSHGSCVFRTWDFGGQREYYATHQYFLSKRSLYLVVWRIPDGQKGISEIMQWLVNIQARAPNSPVVIVGTHYDMMRENYPSSRSEDLQQLIRDKFINVVDAEKCGLPRVLDTIEVSCKTRHNIKLLCNLIYDTAFSLKPPGSKELLLEQRVPASYLALEDVVSHVAAERRQKGIDPVLSAEQYRAVVWSEMQYRYQRTFRDAAELHQATLFLHDNGVMLHYDDATLKDLYFLDPQWLCDMLAHVVTIREINPFARTGVMKLDDLKHVFKSSNLGPVDTRGYIVNLLNKFEVALTWDNRTLLIPSLLPSEDDPHTPSVKVKIPVRSRGWAVRNKKLPPSTAATTVVGNSSFYADLPAASSTSSDSTSGLELNERSDPELAIRRMLLMSYFPSGFWSRLMTRLLADDAIVDIVRSFFIMPKEVAQDAKMAKLLDVRAEWVLWQTGMELRYSDVVLFRMKEVVSSVKNSPIDYRKLRMKLKQEGVWADVDLVNSSILEVILPLDTIVIKRPITDNDEQIGYQAIVLDPSPECAAQLLALAVDHIDILLEDWYPTLGTRFVHTSEGKFLVTRIVPCPRCLASALQEIENDNWPTSRQNLTLPNFSENLNDEMDFNAAGNTPGNRCVRKSQESYTSDGDSGVGPDSPGSSRKPSMEGHPEVINEDEEVVEPDPQYSWMVEECILAAYDKKSVRCPLHGDISLAHIAPDTMFLDLGERHLIRPNSITRGHLLGRGAFGFVFKGTCKVRGSNSIIEVAMKMLQPVAPGPNASQSAVIAYKGAQGKWDRDPLQYASKAYCTARQELNILLTLRHPNIVPLVGVCTKPLALVLDLAPLGALDITLRNYRRSGAKLGAFTLQAVILQVAKAIEYLHQQHIIYRDLKSENVLVWSMPPPFQDHLDVPVYIKLADYGISRLTLPSGTKGFGGTEGFMAPEIMRYNGEEEYTEKVDCFSFGMFIYELLTLHQPFESHESVKECILEGGRPPLTYRETLYPSYMLDLMVLCWCQQPRDRPSASQIVSIASAPEFTHLYDIVSLNHPSTVVATVVATASSSHSTEDGASSSGCDAASGGEIWLACANKVTDQLVVSGHSFVQYSNLVLPGEPTAACLVGNSIWLGDCKGQIHAYFAGDCMHMFSYALDPESPDNAGVCDILHLPHQARVAVGLSNGRVFLVRDDLSPTAPTMGEGSFVLSELGSSQVLHAITTVYTHNHNECQLWCGESDGALSVYTMHENIVTGHKVLNHYEPIIANVHVHQIVSSHTPIMYDGPAAVWTYVHPGCVVYQWDPISGTIVNKLDCSKLVPCSESLKSISIEEHLSPGRCQVTSLCVLNMELYIGTTWGCIVVAERSTMRPITVFRPFQEEVSAILALQPSGQSETLLVTIGQGYRSLIKRYKDVIGTPTLLSQCSQTHNNSFALLWATDNWAAA